MTDETGLTSPGRSVMFIPGFPQIKCSQLFPITLFLITQGDASSPQRGLVYPSRALTKEGYKMEHQTITNIRVGSLLAGNNPRTYFDPVEMAELDQSWQQKRYNRF